MTNAQAFDQAFAPALDDDQVERLARLMGRFNTAQHMDLWPVYTATAHGEPVVFFAPLYARVNGGAIVTDFDCSECGDDGAPGYCEHQRAMLDAAKEWVSQMQRDEDAEDLRVTRAR